MPFELSIASLNAQSTQTITLDSVVYRMVFTFNTRRLAWDLTFGLADGTVLVAGIKLLPQIDLLGRHKDIRLPKGRLFAFDIEDGNTALRSEKSELGTKLRLLYFTEIEVNGLISA